MPRTMLTHDVLLAEQLDRKANELKVINAEQLAARLKEHIVGQDKVIDQIARQLGQRDASKRTDEPIAVFCFVGPPGVGKTELAKAITDAVYKDRNHLLFYSFAEMAKLPQAATTLIGSPKNYVGGEGKLTSDLRRIPNAVVLLDDIEKAHAAVIELILSGWDDGFLTDQQTGHKVPTNGAIFILTSNANSREIGELVEAHTGTFDELNRKVKDLLSVGESALAPELLSRIETVFAFRNIRGIDIARVVALRIERRAKSYGLAVADGGSRKEILIDAVQRLQKTSTKSGVRDITLKLEGSVDDGLIDAKAGGATKVRFEVEDGKVKVVPVTEDRTSVVSAAAPAAS